MGACQIATQACHFCPRSVPTVMVRGIDHNARPTRSASEAQSPQKQGALGLHERRHAPAYRRTASGDNRPEPPHQAINARPLPLFNATPAFETVMIVLNQPSMSIPLDQLPRLFERGGGDRGRQDPFQWLLSARRACSSQTRTTHTVIGSLLARGACARWQERHLPTGKLELRRTPRVTMPGRNLERTARLARKGTGLRQRRADLVFALLHAP